MTTRRTKRRALLAVAAFGAGAALCLAPAPTVLAHAHLVSSSPAANAVLDRSPIEIVLTFDEAIESSVSNILVSNADGAVVAQGTVATGARPEIVELPIAPLDDGAYVVIWRVSSADGHILDGAFTFQIGDGPVVNSDVLLARAGVGERSSALAVLATLARWLALLATMVVVGATVWALFGDPGPANSERVRQVLLGASVIALAAAVVGIGLHGAELRGAGVGDLFSTGAWRRAVGSRVGKALLVRAACAAVWAALAWGWAQRRAEHWQAMAALSGVIGLLTFPVVGHANVQHPRLVWVAIDAVHLAAVSAWVGGLVLFALGGRLWFTIEGEATINRYSRVMLVVVPLIVATGAAQTWRIGGGFGDLTESPWGRALLAKLVGVVAMVTLGAVGRTALHRVGRWSARRTVVVEASLAALVVGLAAALLGSAPRPLQAYRPLSTVVSAAGTTMHVGVTPGGLGRNLVEIRLDTPPGSPEAERVEVRVRPEDQTQPFAPVAVTREAAARFVGEWIVAQPGRWEMEVIVVSGSSTSRTATVVVIPG